jgi:hypothetical protein
MVLLFNYSEAFYQKCLAAGVPKQKLALFAFEPRVVIPEQYEPSTWDQFGKVFTFMDDAIDNKRVFKLRFPQGQKPLKKLPGYKDRKFLTLINANKFSSVPNELYSYRRQAIRYFEGQSVEFDLYGFGWDKGPSVLSKRDTLNALKSGQIISFAKDWLDVKKPYSSYRGSVDDKYATMAGYKYSLCYENEHKVAGYLTEKIFDCFFTGTVPIYLGASNVTDYIPAGCFIDMRNFKDFAELNDYLANLSEKDWLAYQKAGQDYLKSDDFKAWQPEGLFQTIVDVLAPKKS